MPARWASVALYAAIAGMAQSPPETSVISGTILDQQTGQPLKGAEACLTSPGADRRCALTEADGKFQFRVAAGRYTLSASRAGYLSADYGSRPGGRYTVLAVDSELRLENLELRLQRFSIVSGRVVNDDQEPMPYAEVVVWRLPGRGDAGQRLRWVASSATNDLGEYRVPGLHPGNYYVSVAPRLPDLPCLAAKAGIKEAKPGFPRRIYGMTFYPGASDAMQAVPVRVEPGLDLKGIDFTLLPAHAIAVRGKVEMNFQGLASATISLARAGLAAPARFVPVDPADGSFAFCGVLPGRYVLEGSWQEGGKVLHAREEIETGDAPMGEIRVRPSRAAEVTGRVRIDGTASPDLTKVEVVLLGEGAFENTTLKPDHTFVFQSVWPGKYGVDLPNLPLCCYLKSARLRGQDVPRDGIRVEAGESQSGLELVVATDAASITGVVFDRDEKPVAGVLVTIVPDIKAAHPGSSGTNADTDQAGGFLLPGVAPGDYRVYAWQELGDVEWFRPETLAAFRESSTPVSVPGGAAQPITVHLITR